MKVVLLAGGYGTRLSEYTDLIPKPMVSIGDKPILWHIMKRYASFGYKDFIVALGYKSEIIKDYFVNYRTLISDFTIDLGSGEISTHVVNQLDWRVTLVNTGDDVMTGGRLRRLKDYIGDESFLLTYGDGLSDINLEKLVDFHRSHGKLVTVSAVHPSARFGELMIDERQVMSFKEKPQTGEGWINGGFFVIEPEFLEFIEDDFTILEKIPLERAAEMGELMAYQHEGFWQCMDTKRDLDHLKHLWQAGNAPWLK